MKKKIVNLILALASLSGGCFWLITQRSHRWALPIPVLLETRCFQDDALLVCSNIRTTYIKNPWGDLGISASIATISRKHIIRASSITIELKQPDGTSATAKAEHATLTQEPKILALVGNVNIKHTQGCVQADEATLDIDEQALSLTGNVQSEVDLSPVRKQQQR